MLTLWHNTVTPVVNSIMLVFFIFMTCVVICSIIFTTVCYIILAMIAVVVTLYILFTLNDLISTKHATYFGFF